MKFRYYSFNIDCKEEYDYKIEVEEDDGFLEINDYFIIGSKKEWFKIYLFFSIKISFNFCRIYSLFGCKILFSL